MENEEILKKYNLNLEDLKKEQLKLAKSIEAEDSIDFLNAEKFAGISTLIVKSQIIAAIVLCDKDCNILEEQYFLGKLRFPYIYGFRSYREITPIVEAFNKLNEKPDVVFIEGHGITHPRLGLASHFSIITGVPAIGVADNLFEENKLEDGDIVINSKKIGKVLISKPGSSPMYVSPGDKISIASAYELAKKFIRLPHKLPEPLKLSSKYAKSIQRELKLQ
jgi:deoxyribonuclease V